MDRFGIRAAYAEMQLQQVETQIRLLRLHSRRLGDISSSAEGELFRTDLQDAPKYEALSYNWGSPTNMVEITLNGQVVAVKENLESALRHLRHSDKPRILWVDALCINQEDVLERNAQVSIMHEIYRNAQRTIAWVGDGRDDGELALEFLQWHAGRKALMREQDVDGHHPDYERQGWEAVRKLLKRPYWRRLWVMQEIALSIAPPHVICGQARISWILLATALKSDSTAYFVNRLNRIRGATLKFAKRLGNRKPNHVGRHLILLMSHSGGFETTEPRDRVYALYGLFKVIGVVQFVPDYNISIAQVYQQLTEYVLNMKGGLDVLELQPYNSDPNLPSWVVDLSKRPPLSFDRRADIPWQRLEGHELETRAVSEDLSFSRCLKVSGAVVAKVSHVEAIHPCLVNALREAAEKPGARIFGGHSLRSDSAEASRYWNTMNDIAHCDRLCYSSIGYLARWQSMVTFFRESAGGDNDWAPRSWDWQQMVQEVPPCLSHGRQQVQGNLCETQLKPSIGDHTFEARYREALNPLLCSLSIMMQGRTCFSTESGMHGIMLAGVSVGDQVVAFQSTKNLHAIRPSEASQSQHQYVGAAVMCPDEDSDQLLSALYEKVKMGEIQDECFVLR